MSFNYKRILVTGGAGAIGSNLVNYLINQESVEKIIILDNFISGDTLNIQNSSKIILVKGDIVNEIDLKRVFNYKPQIVYHLAAFFANQNSVDYPEKDLNVNILGTLRLLEYSNLSNNIQEIIKNNNSELIGIRDLFFHKDQVLISMLEKNDTGVTINLYAAQMNFKKLNFKIYF